MRVVPVVDLMQGRVVRGLAGQRHRYQPVRSVLTSDASIEAVTCAFVDQLGLATLYVADIDAIQGGMPHWRAYDELAHRAAEIWLDAGVTEVRFASELQDRLGESLHLIVGLETLRSAAHLHDLVRHVGADRLIVSLDLLHGRPRTLVPEWQAVAPGQIAAHLADSGVTRWILLDLGRVGTGTGTGTTELLQELREQHRDWQLICGGGLASVAEIQTLAAAGCSAVLLASCLHDGRIGRAELAACGAYGSHRSADDASPRFD